MKKLSKNQSKVYNLRVLHLLGLSENSRVQPESFGTKPQSLNIRVFAFRWCRVLSATLKPWSSLRLSEKLAWASLNISEAPEVKRYSTVAVAVHRSTYRFGNQTAMLNAVLDAHLSGIIRMWGTQIMIRCDLPTLKFKLLNWPRVSGLPIQRVPLHVQRTIVHHSHDFPPVNFYCQILFGAFK